MLAHVGALSTKAKVGVPGTNTRPSTSLPDLLEGRIGRDV
jgi:hypothetical protein